MSKKSHSADCCCHTCSWDYFQLLKERDETIEAASREAFEVYKPNAPLTAKLADIVRK